MNEAVCILIYANLLRNAINPIFLSPAMSK